jgi:MerR family transcriptional regulator/heat shock protein HspR
MDVDPLDPVFTIRVVARLLGLHEQTIRQYERLGLIKPCRSANQIRMFSKDDVERLERITFLVKECGVNLAGVRIFVQLSSSNEEIEKVFLQQLSLMKHSSEEKFKVSEEPFLSKELSHELNKFKRKTKKKN